MTLNRLSLNQQRLRFEHDTFRPLQQFVGILADPDTMPVAALEAIVSYIAANINSE